MICVVENPRDVTAFERTRGNIGGLYHVLHGLISPMDGVGAEQLCIKELLARIQAGGVKGNHYGDQSHGGGGGDSHVCGEACQASGCEKPRGLPMAFPWAVIWSMPMR